MNILCKKTLTIIAAFTPAICSAGPYYFDDYLPFSNRWSIHKSPSSSSVFGQWATWSNNGTDMIIHWNSSTSSTNFDWNNPQSIERFEIRESCSDTSDWVFLNGYRANHDSNITYWLVTDKATLTVADSTTFNVTNVANAAGGCSRYNSSVDGGSYIGIPYATYTMWDQPYVIEVWGRIAGSDGVADRPFYWKARYEPGISRTNPCWTSTAPTRLTILQKEAYWDSITGWSTGSGTVNYPALTSSGVKYGRYQSYGENAGPMWTSGSIDSSGNMSANQSCIPFSAPYL
jgi:hypothetical protein